MNGVMVSPGIQAKAFRYLAEGKVRVHEATRGAEPTCIVRVHGSADAPYAVWCSGGEWRCDCQARVPMCAHIFAAQLVTIMPDWTDQR